MGARRIFFKRDGGGMFVASRSQARNKSARRFWIDLDEVLEFVCSEFIHTLLSPALRFP
jgi:uncharacterized iron-regulated membrane protein